MTLVGQIAVELKTQMEASKLFPFSDRRKTPPSKQFKPHMRNVALKNNPIIVLSPEIQVFELGNEYAEEKAPQYHILEDSKKIKNPNRGTEQSLGSQRKVSEVRKRDYGKVTYLKGGNIVEIGQEYRQSFRSRSNIWKENLRLSTKRFEQKWNKKRGLRVDNSYRYNIHFGYIERILEEITPLIAQQFNARLIVRDSGSLGDLDGLEIVENGESNSNIGIDDIYEDEYEALYTIKV
jgi:hypothetical protein